MPFLCPPPPPPAVAAVWWGVAPMDGGGRDWLVLVMPPPEGGDVLGLFPPDPDRRDRMDGRSRGRRGVPVLRLGGNAPGISSKPVLCIPYRDGGGRVPNCCCCC